VETFEKSERAGQISALFLGVSPWQCFSSSLSFSFPPQGKLGGGGPLKSCGRLIGVYRPPSVTVCVPNLSTFKLQERDDHSPGDVGGRAIGLAVAILNPCEPK